MGNQSCMGVYFIMDFYKKNGIAYRNPENGILKTQASNYKNFYR